MKKILTITTQYANNQGALLQCYALQKYLSKQDKVSCEVINYYPEGYLNSWKLLPKSKTFRGFLKNIYTLFNVRWMLGKVEKNKVTKRFMHDYIKTTSKSYDRNGIINEPPIGDLYICGSDQIWNFTIFDDMTYYLDFVEKVPGAKRIAYAASLSDPWSTEQEKKVSPILQKYSKIAIREKGNIEQVQHCSPNTHVEWVCDPVFLLTTEEWDQIAKDPQEKEPYILCYFLNIEPESVEFVNKVRKLTGLKVINLVLSSREKFKSDKLVYSYSPCEFIGYIKNAAFIITNSFHCSAFSSMYRKNFRFIPKNWANERLISLEELFGYKVIMTKDSIREFKLEDIPVDYKDADRIIEFVERSKKYLVDAIND